MALTDKEIQKLIKAIEELPDKLTTALGSSGNGGVTHDGKQQLMAANELNKVIRDRVKLVKGLEDANAKGLINSKKYNASKAELDKLEKRIATARKSYAKSLTDTTKTDAERLSKQASVVKLLEKEALLMAEMSKDLNEEVEKREKIKKTIKDSVGGEALLAKGISIVKNVAKQTLTTFIAQDQAIRDAGKSIGVNEAGFNRLGNQVSRVIGGKNGLAQIGLSMADMAKMQSSYADATGKAMMFTDDQAIAMGNLAQGTILGVEGASELAGSMELVGINAKEVANVTEGTLEKARKAGVSGAQATKALVANMKVAQQYNFSGGKKALEDMAVTATKLGISMQSIGAMADKAFNVEGAVEMSAQLNVLGGGFAKIGDWSSLLYKSREDVKGLQDDIGKAMENYAEWDPAAKMYRTNSIEKQRAMEAAKALGMSFEELNTIGLKSASIRDAKREMKGLSDEAKNMFSSMAFRDEKTGEMKIQLGETGEIMKLSQVTQQMFENQKGEEANLAKRAELASGFDTVWKSLKETFAAELYPVLRDMVPQVKGFVNEVVRPAIVFISDVVKPVLSFLGPAGIAGVAIAIGAIDWGLKGGIFGASAGAMFNLTTLGKMGGGGIGSAAKSIGGGIGGLLKGGGGIALGGVGLGMLNQHLQDNGTIQKNGTGAQLMNVGSKAAEWGGMGMMIGSVIPGVGNVVGGAVGALAGAGYGMYQNSKASKSMGDGIVRSDGTVVNIDSNDSILAAKPGGVIDNVLSNATGSGGNSTAINGEISLTPLKIEGNINLTYNGDSKSMNADDLLNNSSFINQLTKKLQEEIRKSTNGGSLQPASL